MLNTMHGEDVVFWVIMGRPVLQALTRCLADCARLSAGKEGEMLELSGILLISLSFGLVLPAIIVNPRFFYSN
jgi:hypothetical protein